MGKRIFLTEKQLKHIMQGAYSAVKPLNEEGREMVVGYYNGHVIRAIEDSYGWEYYCDDDYMHTYLSVDEVKKIIDRLNSMNRMVAEDIGGDNPEKMKTKNDQGKSVWDPNKTWNMKFDTSLRDYTGGQDKYNASSYNMKKNQIVRYYEFDDNNFVMSPISKQLKLRDGQIINAWGLGSLISADFNHAIKKDEMSNKVVKANFNNKDLFLSYCAKYFAKMLPYVCKYERLNVGNIGYIAWPYSSSNFNQDFVTNQLVPALQNEGINITTEDIIPNIVVKGRAMKLNLDLAKQLGCDDVDIKSLEIFCAEQAQINTVFVARQKIDSELDRIAEDLNNNNVDQYYQYSTGSRKEEENNKDTLRTDNGMYLNNAETDDWRYKNNNEKGTGVSLKNAYKQASKIKNKENYEISSNFNQVADILKKYKEQIIKYYEDAEKKYQEIANSDTVKDEQGREINLKNTFGHFNNSDNKVAGHSSGRFLDSTLGDNGKAKAPKWEIKKFSEVCRRVLYDLFELNSENLRDNYDKSKILILFDDNVAGGNTLAKVCETLMAGENGWKTIIPITISFMGITDGVTGADRTKQEYRDNIAKQNGYYTNGSETLDDDNDNSYAYHNIDTRRGDTEFNDERINWYDIHQKEVADRRQQKIDTTTEPKRRGRPRKEVAINTGEPKRRGRPRKEVTYTANQEGSSADQEKRERKMEYMRNYMREYMRKRAAEKRKQLANINENIESESCDYVFNDEGQKCNSTGTVWKDVVYAKNKKDVPEGIGAYPFIIHNGQLFASTTPNGHGDFVKNDVLPKTEYNGVMVNSLKNELSINNRHVSICGRLFPNVNSDGSSIITVWNAKEHGLTDERSISALIKLIADYFKIEPSMIAYEVKSGQQIRPTYQATDEDVKNLLQHNREIAQTSGLKSIEQYNTAVNDDELYTGYARKPYSELTPREKEMFSQLRGQEPRGNAELRDYLTKHNPNFTQAQWNAMSTIGDSKTSRKTIVSESELRGLIRNSIIKKLNERATLSEKTNVTVCSLEEFYDICNNLGLNRDVTGAEMSNIVGDKYAFIEIGSCENRWRAEVNHSINSYNNDADKAIEGQLYFHNAMNGEIYNVLQLIYDDNQEIDNHRKKQGDKNTYAFGNTDDEFDTTCVNLSPEETQSGKKDKFFYAGGKGFAMDDAKKIQAFVNGCISNNNDVIFIIHCRQGTSRSAAVGEYCVRKISQVKNTNWEDDMTNYFDEHWIDKNNGKHQFRIGYGSKGPRYPHKNSLGDLGGLEGWNAQGRTKKDGSFEHGDPTWMKDFQTRYGDKQGWVNPRNKITESDLVKMIRESIEKIIKS